MTYKIVLAFAIVVGVLVDCRSLERQNEDAEMREAIQELAGSKEVTDDEVKQAIEQLENVTGIKLREAIQELNNYLAGRKEVSNEEVKQAIEQLENVDGFETVNETEQLREAEGGKRQNVGLLLKVLFDILIPIVTVP